MFVYKNITGHSCLRSKHRQQGLHCSWIRSQRCAEVLGGPPHHKPHEFQQDCVTHVPFPLADRTWALPWSWTLFTYSSVSITNSSVVPPIGPGMGRFRSRGQKHLLISEFIFQWPTWVKGDEASSARGGKTTEERQRRLFASRSVRHKNAQNSFWSNTEVLTWWAWRGI